MIIDTIAQNNKEVLSEKIKNISKSEMMKKAFELRLNELGIKKPNKDMENEDIYAILKEKNNSKCGFEFEKKLKEDGMSFICECKKASPSKGLISKDFDYKSIARDYESAGASCISVLTEPKWFMGDISYISDIKNEVNIPLLRKDFVIDEYMIYEAKVYGAGAVLLICSLLDTFTLKSYIKTCDLLGISALVEAHNEDEIKSAIKAGAKIIGVNNRDLRTFEVDFNNALKLRKMVPDDIIFIAESGIKDADDIKLLYDNKVDAVLIGETLMRAEDKKSAILDLKSKLGERYA